MKAEHGFHFEGFVGEKIEPRQQLESIIKQRKDWGFFLLSLFCFCFD